jgi:hypothetical protein
MFSIETDHVFSDRAFDLTRRRFRAHHHGSPVAMTTRTPARAAVLSSVAVRLFLLVLLLGILPGGFAA